MTSLGYTADRLVESVQHTLGGGSGVANETLLARRVYGDGVDEPLVGLGSALPGGRLWYYQDRLGSVVATVDGEGATHRAYYGAWGGLGAGSELVDRYGWTGREHDRVVGLINLRDRYYDPTTGRFWQEDSAETDTNPYRYAGNSPTNATDPSGRIAGWLMSGIAGYAAEFGAAVGTLQQEAVRQRILEQRLAAGNAARGMAAPAPSPDPRWQAAGEAGSAMGNGLLQAGRGFLERGAGLGLDAMDAWYGMNPLYREARRTSLPDHPLLQDKLMGLLRELAGIMDRYTPRGWHADTDGRESKRILESFCDTDQVKQDRDTLLRMFDLINIEGLFRGFVRGQETGDWEDYQRAAGGFLFDSLMAWAVERAVLRTPGGVTHEMHTPGAVEAERGNTVRPPHTDGEIRPRETIITRPNRVMHGHTEWVIDPRRPGLAEADLRALEAEYTRETTLTPDLNRQRPFGETRSAGINPQNGQIFVFSDVDPAFRDGFLAEELHHYRQFRELGLLGQALDEIEKRLPNIRRDLERDVIGRVRGSGFIPYDCRDYEPYTKIARPKGVAGN